MVYFLYKKNTRSSLQILPRTPMLPAKRGSVFWTAVRNQGRLAV
jgi:hypothetical protein